MSPLVNETELKKWTQKMRTELAWENPQQTELN